MNLEALLEDPNITVPQLFQQPDILSQLKYKITKFVDFCKTNEDFTTIMITLGIKTPMHCNDNLEMRKVAHVASDLLTSDNDAIADLFIIDQVQPRIRCYSEDDDQVLEEIVSNEATGEHLIIQRSTSKEAKVYSDFEKKYLYLLNIMQYLSVPNQDENCINYLMKVFNTLIRVKPEQMFAFFNEKPELMRKMVELTNYPSISYSIAKIINEGEDKKHREFKIQVVEMIIKEILCKIKTDGFGVYAEFIEEVFEKNRHRGEEQDQIKIATQPLVNQAIINSMLDGVFSGQSPINTSNCLLYLFKVVERMNVDEEQDPYSYNEPQNNKPTMDFQVNLLFQSFDRLVEMALKLTRQIYTPTQILVFYDLLLAMTRNSRFKSLAVDKVKCITTLLKIVTENEKSNNGIIKNKIILLIENILNQGQENLDSNQNQEALTQVAKISPQNAEAVCYKDKLTMMLSYKFDDSLCEVQWKYANVLAPTNFTENRNFKVKQLEFVKVYAKKKEQVEKERKGPESKQSSLQSSPDKPIVTQEAENSDKNGSDPQSIGINLNLLNSKINAKKSKKQNTEAESVLKVEATQPMQQSQKQRMQQSQKQQKKLESQQAEEKKEKSQEKGKVEVKEKTDKPKNQEKSKGQEKEMEKEKEKIEKSVESKENVGSLNGKEKSNEKEKSEKEVGIGFYVRYLPLF